MNEPENGDRVTWTTSHEGVVVSAKNKERVIVEDKKTGEHFVMSHHMLTSYYQ